MLILAYPICLPLLETLIVFERVIFVWHKLAMTVCSRPTSSYLPKLWWIGVEDRALIFVPFNVFCTGTMVYYRWSLSSIEDPTHPLHSGLFQPHDRTDSYRFIAFNVKCKDIVNAIYLIIIFNKFSFLLCVITVVCDPNYSLAFIFRRQPSYLYCTALCILVVPKGRRNPRWHVVNMQT